MMTNAPNTNRSTAAKRREHLLEVAITEFATRGYAGGSTERIAQAAGISQPYVFRLYGSKQQLFLAAIERCMLDTLTMFEQAVGQLRGEAALEAISRAYEHAVAANPTRLQMQLVGYVSCTHPEVRLVMREGYGKLVTFVEQVSGANGDRVATFFGKGMLFNVITAMQLPDEPVEWGQRLIDGCMTSAG